MVLRSSASQLRSSASLNNFHCLGLQVETDWKLEEAFVLEQMQAAFRYDVRSEFRKAISYEVNTSKEINGIFNLFTYSKGAAVIRMLQHAIGDDSFVAGLREYLKTRYDKLCISNA